jgi:malonyl-CoA/methylmalonyl-CoA synthetase
MAYFIKDAAPAVVVCSGRNFGWTSKMAFLAGHILRVHAQ